MNVEVVLAALLVLFALLFAISGVAGWGWRIAILALAVGTSLGLYFRHHQIEEASRVEREHRAEAPSDSRDGGFVSSGTCRACHPAEYESWHGSFHRSMTQYPDADVVRGDFDNVDLEYWGQDFHLSRRADGFYVNMVDPDWTLHNRPRRRRLYSENPASIDEELFATGPRTTKRISLVTGSHHMQAYWVPGRIKKMQLGFPFTFLYEANRWVPREDVFLIPPEWLFPAQVWNANCVRCHATFSQARMIRGADAFDTRAAEMGIACEACHGPGNTHVGENRNPAERYRRYAETDKDREATGQEERPKSIFDPGDADHVKSSEVCGVCHAIRQLNNREQWNIHGLVFRPGGDIEAEYPLMNYSDDGIMEPGNERVRALMEGSFWGDGMVRVSGREFNGLAHSPCFEGGELGCLSCHSMHGYESNDDQLKPGMRTNTACTQCHAEFESKLSEHTHHEVDSKGSLCTNCHMPYTSYGLLKAIRSHQIASPSIGETVDHGRPNACNACHIDQTLAWSAKWLAEWYNQDVPPLTEDDQSVAAAIHWAVAGDAGQRALAAWYIGWETARHSSDLPTAAPVLAELLDDNYAAVRYIAGRSLSRLEGFEDFEFDFVTDPDDRDALRPIVTAKWQALRSGSASVRPELLLTEQGFDEKHFASLRSRRNERQLMLLE